MADELKYQSGCENEQPRACRARYLPAATRSALSLWALRGATVRHGVHCAARRQPPLWLYRMRPAACTPRHSVRQGRHCPP